MDLNPRKFISVKLWYINPCKIQSLPKNGEINLGDGKKGDDSFDFFRLLSLWQLVIHHCYSNISFSGLFTSISGFFVCRGMICLTLLFGSSSRCEWRSFPWLCWVRLELEINELLSRSGIFSLSSLCIFGLFFSFVAFFFWFCHYFSFLPYPVSQSVIASQYFNISVFQYFSISIFQYFLKCATRSLSNQTFINFLFPVALSRCTLDQVPD